jgi:hypothetical protein
MGQHNRSTESGKDPYIRIGNYERLFWHLYANASPQFKKRMDRQKALDEKRLKMINNHYPKDRAR